MGLLDAFAAQADTSAPSPLVALPRTAGERFGAAVSEEFAPDRYFNLEASRRDWYNKINDQLYQGGQPPLPLPGDPPSHEELDAQQGNVLAIQQDRAQKFVDVTRAAQQTNPDQILAENIDAYIGQAGQRARDTASSYVGTGNGWAAFAGATLAPTPENLAAFLIPPSRAVMGATEIGGAFLRGVLREGAYQGAAMGTLTAAAQGLDVTSREETGTAPGLGEVAGNVASAVAGGAVLGAGFHALLAGPRALWDRWNALPQATRDAAPLATRDAFGILEKDVLYSGQNRLGLDPLLHERYQGNALDAILRGTPVNLDELRPGDTPMTGLATVLQSAPDQIRATGLGNTMGRLASLPEAEIEQLGRQLKPEVWAPLDAIDQKLGDLDRRTQDIHDEAQQIGLSDVADIDTAARLQDVDAQLAKTGIRKATRADLERERETITQSIDPNGQLTEELKNTRRDFFPEHAQALKDIETERDSLMKQRASAQSVVSRETSAMRKRLESLDAGSQFADEAPAETLAKEFDSTPADMTAALHGAEFSRLATIARQSVPAASGRAPVDLKVNTPASKTAPPPDIDVSGLMKGKSASEARTALLKELEDHELSVKDAQAAANCVANGGGIP